MDMLKFQLFVGVLIRWGLSVVAGILIQKGFLSSDSEGEFIAAGVALLVPVLWGLTQKWRQVETLDKALDLPAGSERNDLKGRW